MKNAKLTVINFNDNDVIATSGAITVTWTGLWDSEKGNATLHYGELEFFGTSGKGLADFNAATGMSFTDATHFKQTADADSAATLFVSDLSSSLVDNGTANDSKAAKLNGTYTWDPTVGTSGAFVKTTN